MVIIFESTKTLKWRSLRHVDALQPRKLSHGFSTPVISGTSWQFMCKEYNVGLCHMGGLRNVHQAA